MVTVVNEPINVFELERERQLRQMGMILGNAAAAGFNKLIQQRKIDAANTQLEQYRQSLAAQGATTGTAAGAGATVQGSTVTTPNMSPDHWAPSKVAQRYEALGGVPGAGNLTVTPSAGMVRGPGQSAEEIFESSLPGAGAPGESRAAITGGGVTPIVDPATQQGEGYSSGVIGPGGVTPSPDQMKLGTNPQSGMDVFRGPLADEIDTLGRLARIFGGTSSPEFKAYAEQLGEIKMRHVLTQQAEEIGRATGLDPNLIRSLAGTPEGFETINSLSTTQTNAANAAINAARQASDAQTKVDLKSPITGKASVGFYDKNTGVTRIIGEAPPDKPEIRQVTRDAGGGRRVSYLAVIDPETLEATRIPQTSSTQSEPSQKVSVGNVEQARKILIASGASADDVAGIQAGEPIHVPRSLAQQHPTAFKGIDTSEELSLGVDANGNPIVTMTRGKARERALGKSDEELIASHELMARNVRLLTAEVNDIMSIVDETPEATGYTGRGAQLTEAAKAQSRQAAGMLRQAFTTEQVVRAQDDPTPVKPDDFNLDDYPGFPEVAKQSAVLRSKVLGLALFMAKVENPDTDKVFKHQIDRQLDVLGASGSTAQDPAQFKAVLQSVFDANLRRVQETEKTLTDRGLEIPGGPILEQLESYGGVVGRHLQSVPPGEGDVPPGMPAPPPGHSYIYYQGNFYMVPVDRPAERK